jgi:hypothetical protein
MEFSSGATEEQTFLRSELGKRRHKVYRPLFASCFASSRQVLINSCVTGLSTPSACSSSAIDLEMLGVVLRRCATANFVWSWIS